jgi:hypothetical protein
MTPRLTREQAAIIGAFTGITCGPFADIHAYAKRKFGRPLWTHQFAEPEIVDKLRELARDDFLAIAAEEEKP